MYIRSNHLVDYLVLDIHSSLDHQALERLLGLGQTDGVVANIIDAVPAAQEGVTQDS